MSSGGFDVIIGNPPYLEYQKVKNYKIRDYSTQKCSNLYAFTVERSFVLINVKGRSGMIIPISVACSGAMQPLPVVISPKLPGRCGCLILQTVPANCSQELRTD